MLARDPFPIHTREVIASGVSRDENRALLFDTITRAHLRTLLAQRPAAARPLLKALGHPAKSIAQHAFDLALELGRPCGLALATLLPAMFVAAEHEQPQHALDLREVDSTLCAAIALIEQLAPERLPALSQAVAQRGANGTLSWWTFRARQRLRDALQRRQVFLN